MPVLDKRLAAVAQRSEWRADASGALFAPPMSDIENCDHKTTHAEDPTCAARAHASHEAATSPWTLPRVAISATDEQHLFELNVKLQYAEEETALILALQDLAGATVLDFPAEAFLQRQPLLDTVLAVLGNEIASAQARLLALSFLQTLVTKLKQALVDTVDPELLPGYAGVLLVRVFLVKSGGANKSEQGFSGTDSCP